MPTYWVLHLGACYYIDNITVALEVALCDDVDVTIADVTVDGRRVVIAQVRLR